MATTLSWKIALDFLCQEVTSRALDLDVQSSRKRPFCCLCEHCHSLEDILRGSLGQMAGRLGENYITHVNALLYFKFTSSDSGELEDEKYIQGMSTDKM